MPTIPCELLGTWTKRQTGAQSITATSADVMRSAAIVGIPLLASDLAAERPLLEMMWRMMMVKANLRPSSGGLHWTRTDAYDRLDPSEKVAVSYFLGMVQSHLIATKLLRYSHLVHVDRLLVAARAPLKASRPDFVAIHMGSGAARTHAATWEAKGRTNAFDSKALKTAKDQAKIVPLIAGLKARETVASEAYFATKTDVWEAKLRDPEWAGTRIDAGLETYLLTYYLPIIRAGRETGNVEQNDEAFEFTVPGFDLTVSLPRALSDAVDRAEGLDVEERDEAKLVTTAYRRLTESDGDVPKTTSDDDAREADSDDTAHDDLIQTTFAEVGDE